MDFLFQEAVRLAIERRRSFEKSAEYDNPKTEHMNSSKYNETEIIDNFKAEGRAEERASLVRKALSKMKSCEDVADFLDVPIEEVQAVLESTRK